MCSLSVSCDHYAHVREKRQKRARIVAKNYKEIESDCEHEPEDEHDERYEDNGNGSSPSSEGRDVKPLRDSKKTTRLSRPLEEEFAAVARDWMSESVRDW